MSDGSNIYSINGNKLMSIECKFKCDECSDGKYKWMNSNSKSSKGMKCDDNGDSGKDNMLWYMNNDSIVNSK